VSEEQDGTALTEQACSQCAELVAWDTTSPVICNLCAIRLDERRRVWTEAADYVDKYGYGATAKVFRAYAAEARRGASPP
jgi:hypothetical protein